MEDERFEERLVSLREAGAILRWGLALAHATCYETLDLRWIRKKVNISQSQFAEILGGSVRTLRNWEKLHQVPTTFFHRLSELVAENQLDGQAVDAFIRSLRDKQLTAEINDAFSTPPTEDEIKIMKFCLSHMRVMARRDPWE